jgi:hypothetical protein
MTPQEPLAAHHIDTLLWTLLGDELELAALPLPGRVPSIEDFARYAREALASGRVMS